MRCKHCRYRLDGLADNRCPECGEAFDPGDPDLYDLIRTRRVIAFVAGVTPVVFALLFIAMFELLSWGFDSRSHTAAFVFASVATMLLWPALFLGGRAMMRRQRARRIRDTLANSRDDVGSG